MKHIVVGLVAVVLAVSGLIVWWKTFGIVMRGVMPFALLVFGLVSIASGLRRIQSSEKSAKAVGAEGK